MSYKITKICCYTGYITQAVAINFAPLLFVTFQNTFNISYALIGTLVLINFLVQLGTDIISVFFLDKIGFRVSAVLSQIFAATGFMLLSVLPYMMPNAFLGICIATMIYSVGAGLIEVVINPIMASIPSEGKGLVFLHSFYCWGQLFVVLLTTLALKVFGASSWVYISPIWGLIPLINGIIFLKAPIAPPESEEKTANGVGLLKNNLFICLAVLMVCAGASELAMGQWASTFAQNALGIDKLTGDLLGPCLFAFFMGIGRTVFGIKGDNLNYKKHMIICSSLCILCYVAAALSKNPYIALLGCAFCGYAVSILWPGTVDLASRIFPNGSGAMYSMIAIFGDVGCSIGPFLTGIIASLKIFGSNALKAGLLLNIIYPLVYILIIVKKRGIYKEKQELS